MATNKEGWPGRRYNLFSDPDILNLPGPLALFQEPLASLISKTRAPKSREGSPARVFRELGERCWVRAGVFIVVLGSHVVFWESTEVVGCFSSVWSVLPGRLALFQEPRVSVNPQISNIHARSSVDASKKKVALSSKTVGSQSKVESHKHLVATRRVVRLPVVPRRHVSISRRVAGHSHARVGDEL